jgi:hypothetical protein
MKIAAFLPYESVGRPEGIHLESRLGMRRVPRATWPTSVGPPGGRAPNLLAVSTVGVSAVVPRTKQFDEDDMRLAVVAHVRHVDTDYDALVGRGVDRYDARQRVQAQIGQLLADWEARGPDVIG